MNERIRELAEQAVKVVDNPFPGNPLNDELEKMYIPDCFAEKFAELIVRECAEWMESTNNDSGDRIGDSTYWSGKMKQHFGVE